MLEILGAFIAQVRESSLNWILAAFLAFLLHAYWTQAKSAQREAGAASQSAAKHADTVVYRQFTPRELAKHDGRSGTDIYLAVKGKVFDVTPGKAFYGPDGPYGNFAGRDASRGLAYNSFDLSVITPLGKPIDKLQDLTQEQRQSLDDWYNHFAKKYDEVGTLVDEENAEE